jgi:hypothetical protein
VSANMPSSTRANEPGGNIYERLSSQYGQTTSALGDMGFNEHDGIPSYELVRDAIRPYAGWLSIRLEAGHHDELVIAPSLQVVGLVGDHDKPGLIPRFDEKQSLPTIVNGPIQGFFKDKSPVHDNGTKDVFPVAILLGDISAPDNPSQPANVRGEPGLVYTDMNVADQRRALHAEQDMHAQAGRLFAGVTVGQIIMVNAARRAAGQRRLDVYTQTRLVHYPNRKNEQNFSSVPSTDITLSRDSTNSRQWVKSSKVKNASPELGVRRVLRLPLEFIN